MTKPRRVAGALVSLCGLPLRGEPDQFGGRVSVPLDGCVSGRVVRRRAVVLIDQDPRVTGLRDVRDDAHNLRGPVLMDALGDGGAGGRGQEGQNGSQGGDDETDGGGGEGSKHDLGPS